MDSNLYELTNSQKNIYLREQSYDKTPINIVSFSYIINKDVNIEICKKAINEIIKRNDAIRFQIIKNTNGIFQKIIPYSPEDISVIDCADKTLDEVKSVINSNVNIPFDPFENNKLYRVTIYKLENNNVVINFVLHHIISDGWTSKVIFKQFNTYYYYLSNNIDIPDNPPSYMNYINSEKEYMQSLIFEKDKNYWENYIKNIPEMLPFKENILKKSSNVIRYTDTLSLELSESINEFCRTQNVSAYVFFIAVYAMYLYKTTKKNDFIIGTPLLNRKNRAEKDTVGMFVATVPLRIKIDENTTISDLLKSIHHDTFEALRHQRYPYSYLLDYAKKVEHVETNLFDTIISFQNVCGDSDYVDYEINNFWSLPTHQQSSFEFHISDHNSTGKYTLDMDYSEGVVRTKEMEFIYKRFTEIINNLISQKYTLIDELPYIPNDELDMILNKFNTNKRFTPDKTLIELLEEQAIKTPDNVAVKYKDQELTYKEFIQKIYNFAYVLQSQGVKPNDGVTLLINRSLEMLIAMFAVLKCGAHYLPVDPLWPSDRVKFILQDSKSNFLVTHNSFINTFSKDANCINVDNIIKLPDVSENMLNKVDYDLSSLAYIIYTSGTTGKPKGILTTNYNIVYLLNSTRDKLVQNENDVWTLFHTYTFDFSTWEIYASLLYGGKLVIVPKEVTVNPRKFLHLLVDEKVTILNQTPAYFYKVLEEEKLDNLKREDIHIRAILVGGEAVYAKPFAYWKEKYPQTTIFEVYGPTESTIFATMCEITDSDIKNNETFIGYPLQYYSVYILDKDNQILPIGCDGEICIASGGLCRGYLNNQELTDKKFIYSNILNKKIYKSGDLGFYDTDGRIGYIGRNDNQVKIRGFRVEIGEIEKEILACGNVSKVLVMPVENKNFTKSLVGFIETTIPNYTDTVIDNLRKKLTPYMIPKLYQFEAFPLNDNGKIDRKKLLAIIEERQNQKEIVLPRNSLEKEIYDVVSKVISKNDISVTDDFFDDLGMDSLNIMELTIKLAKYHLEIQDINDAPSIEALAKKIQEVKKGVLNNILEDVHVINKTVNYDLSNVLLTGTTGFLGVHILKELLENNETKKIYCLIRKKNNKDAFKRISDTFCNYFGDIDFSKIEVIEGNFEYDNLALPDELYDSLCKKITTVIHCGANVKHYGKYDAFYKSNVLGTTNIIKFCENSKSKLAHISTLSVGGYTKINNPSLLDENTINVGQEFKKHVYMITKYQAECEVLKAIMQNKIDAKIFRLGNIMPRFSDGKFQTNFTENAFISRLHTIIKTKKLTEEYKNFTIDISPVDLCAKSIITVLKNSNNQTVYHIYNPNIVSINTLLAYMDISISTVSSDELIDELKESNDPHDAHLLNDLLESEYTETPTTNVLTVNLLNKFGFNWNTLDKNYLNNILDIEGAEDETV